MNTLQYKLRRRTAVCLLGGILLTLVVAIGVLARSDNSYDLRWWTVDSGGYTWSVGGGYTLGSTIGQPDAGVTLNGGEYGLSGGFWGGIVEQISIYLPLVLRNP